MKVQELLENDTNLDLTPKNVQKIDIDKVQRIGSGLQATVSKTKSNTIVKKASVHNDRHPEQDAYVQYVKLISEHQSNPFFPRIYSAKLYRVAPEEGAEIGRMYIVVHMERLHELRDEKIKDVAMQVSQRLGIANLTDKSFDNSASRFSIAEETSHPQLREAIFLMEPLFQQFGSDLHLGNWMVRLTSTGPQLVFSDPFIG